MFLGEVNLFMRWSDWTEVDQDYDLHLVRWDGAEWVTVASSTDVQNGSPGQTPTEWVAAGLDVQFGYGRLHLGDPSGASNLDHLIYLPAVFKARP